jgi:hypothetical protein
MWMDTLCIPVQPEQADLRMKAINRMALIYTGAKQVLVLDAELGQVDRRSEPRELTDARISAQHNKSITFFGFKT